MAPPRTIRKEKFGKTVFSVVAKDGLFFGLADRAIVSEETTADAAWKSLMMSVGETMGRYIGWEGAQKLFLYYYPGGFVSAAFSERPYKLKAKEKLDTLVPLKAALAGTGDPEAVLSVFRATDMLYPIEKSRVQEVLRSPMANDFIQASANFAGGDRKQSLRELHRILSPFEANKWTIVTYLPFLWKPFEHMFLKPDATKDFAERVGHRFANAYNTDLDLRTYDALLDLAETTTEKLSELVPRDNLDIQSFIWVVSGAYNGEKPRM
jgi:hypothetical protein